MAGEQSTKVLARIDAAIARIEAAAARPAIVPMPDHKEVIARIHLDVAASIADIDRILAKSETSNG